MRAGGDVVVVAGERALHQGEGLLCGYELLRLRSGARVADVGCGLAVAELGARWADAVGIDADPAMVAAALASRHGADIRQGDATAIAC